MKTTDATPALTFLAAVIFPWSASAARTPAEQETYNIARDAHVFAYPIVTLSVLIFP